MVKALFCRARRLLGRDHQWRRARKHESSALKFCRLCGATRAVKRRKVAE